MDIQPAFNEFKAVIHMYSYFPKSESQCSKAMQKVLKVAFQNNMHYYERMKTSSQAYLSKCSEGSLSHPQQLKLRRVSPAVHFVNTNAPEKELN